MGKIVNMPIIDLENYRIEFWKCKIDIENYCIENFTIFSGGGEKFCEY